VEGFTSINMRSFGTEISANRRRNAELSPEQRSSILSALHVGKSPTETANTHNVARRTVYTRPLHGAVLVLRSRTAARTARSCGLEFGG
jgi:DNA-directed RNA polymerase specialized sigma24 family protein